MGFGLLASTHRIDFVQRDITAYDNPVFYSGHHRGVPAGGAVATGTAAAVAAKEAAIHNSHDNRHSGETATDPHHGHTMATGFNQGNPAVPVDAEKTSTVPAGGDPGMRGAPDMSTPAQQV